MADYSYFCKFCGVSFLSDSKVKVKEFRQEHNRKVKNPLALIQGGPMMFRRDCPMEQTGAGTFARPDLAKHILKSKARQQG